MTYLLIQLDMLMTYSEQTNCCWVCHTQAQLSYPFSGSHYIKSNLDPQKPLLEYDYHKALSTILS